MLKRIIRSYILFIINFFTSQTKNEKDPELKNKPEIEPDYKTKVKPLIQKPAPFKTENPTDSGDSEIDPQIQSAINFIAKDRALQKTFERFQHNMIQFFKEEDAKPSIDYVNVKQVYCDIIDTLHESVRGHLEDCAQAIISKLRFQHSLDKPEATKLFNLACQEIIKTLPSTTPENSSTENLEEIKHYLEYVKSQLENGKEHMEINDFLTNEYQLRSKTIDNIYWLAKSNLSSNTIENAINSTHELIEKNQQLGSNINEITKNIAYIFSQNTDLEQSKHECFELLYEHDNYRNPLFLQLHICNEFNINLSAAEIIYDFSLNRLTPGVEVSDYYVIFKQAEKQGIENYHHEFG